jgi:hypothetical protein
VLRLVAVGGAMVIVAMAGAAAWIITKYTRDLLDARSELEMLNVDLEERVRLRTNGLARAETCENRHRLSMSLPRPSFRLPSRR